MGDSEEVTRNDGPGVDAWEAWTPVQAAAQLAEVGVAWRVVGGWAVDLFLGEQTRPHGDLEIAIARGDFPRLREHLQPMEVFAVGDGRIIGLSGGEESPADLHQRWILDTEHQKWRMDVMLQPGTTETWVYRRDESITAPMSEMVGVTPDGIPFEMPQGVLLYKAKVARPKDEADLTACLPRMEEAPLRWLHKALTQVHPGHPWTGRIRL